MKIQCDCSAFQAELTGFPKNSPGRVTCYCEDCQAYLERLGRPEHLDEWGGTDIVPVYPSEFEVIAGLENLRCNRLTPDGLHRWSTTCCNSPIVNTRAGFPWAGIVHSAIKAHSPEAFDGLGESRSRIMGKDAKGTAPSKISQKIGMSDMLTVLPFIVKGKLLGKHKPSIFFEEDNETATVEPVILNPAP